MMCPIQLAHEVSDLSGRAKLHDSYHWLAYDEEYGGKLIRNS